MTHRHTTISTVGWLPGLTRFIDEVEEPIRLALSLHAPEAGLRSGLMPVNDRYPLDGRARGVPPVRRASRPAGLRRVRHARRINDSREHARELARLLGPKEFKVNLIPYNPTGNDLRGTPLEGSPRGVIEEFRAILGRAGVPATVRLTRGRDIAAACGQLVASRA